VDWDTEKYIPDKATELLIKSLRLFPAIRPFVKSICCIDYDEEGAQKNYYGPDVNDLVEDLLPLLPSVNQLYIQATGLRRLDYFIFSCADRWITLEFDEIDLDGMSADTKFTNLKRLKLGYISGSDKHKYFHLPKLTHLEINQESIEPIRITDITSSQIRFLRLQVLDLFHSPNLCQLPTLKHLEIVSPAIGRNTITLRTVETLSRYHSLETLVINVTSTERNSILFKLLESLPPSITRLEFPDHVPFRPLFRYAQTDHPKSIRYIVFPKANIQKEEDFEMKVKSLKRMYRKQDIKIRYLEDKPSEFGSVLNSLVRSSSSSELDSLTIVLLLLLATLLDR
jgi:hypothetical protein